MPGRQVHVQRLPILTKHINENQLIGFITDPVRLGPQAEELQNEDRRIKD